jgi:hypothetical protein
MLRGGHSLGKNSKIKKEEREEKEVVMDSQQIKDLKNTQKTPQEFLNERLLEHEKFNSKSANELNRIINSQKNTILLYKKEASRYKSVSILKKIVIKFKEIYEVKFKKDKEQIEELKIAKKQVKSGINELIKGEQKRQYIVKFLKIPYKKDYQANDINELLSMIENESTTKEEAKKTIMIFKKRLEGAINSFYELKKLNDFRHRYFIINEKYDPTKILESRHIIEMQKQNEELVLSAFKLLKTNVEMTLLIDENIKSKEHSKLFVNFLKELKKKMDDSYENIGKEELKKLSEEIKEEEKINKTKENIEESKETLEKAVDDEIDDGNNEIAKALINATPKEHKK